jgi:hypothetical protein
VQLIGAVVAMQSARHDKRYAISSIAAHPCKKRKDGAPAFRCGKTKEAMAKAGPAGATRRIREIGSPSLQSKMKNPPHLRGGLTSQSNELSPH